MKRQESDRLKGMFRERSMDFWTTEDGEFDPKAWRKYLKKIKVKMIEDDDVCETYNNSRPDTVMVENPHMGSVWMLVPSELALKSLVLGQLPPRYSKKPLAKG